MRNDSLDKSLSNYVRSARRQTTQAGQVDNSTDVIKNFIEHVRSILPLLEHVKDSIAESSNKIPKASMQLSKVTEATESATVEILNVLEAMTSKITAGQKDLKTVKQFLQNSQNNEGKEEAERALAEVEETLVETKDNSTNIAVALQVQDITSQQIAGVAHTIESIRSKLVEALVRFDNPEDGTTSTTAGTEGLPEPKSTTGHFDGDAHFSTTTERQDLADEIVKQWNGKHPTTPTL